MDRRRGIQRAAGRTGPFMKRRAGTERRGRVGVLEERGKEQLFYSLQGLM